MQPKEDTTPHLQPRRFAMWGDLVTMACIFLCATLVAALLLVVTGGSEIGENPAPYTAYMAYVMQFSLAIAGIWLYCRKRSPERFFSLCTNWSTTPFIIWGIVLATAAGIVLEPLLALFPERYIEQLGEAVGRGGPAILFSVVLAPILEEVLFRGLVLEYASRRWSALWAVTASALLFGLAHMPILPQMVNAFVVGIALGYIYILTRSLVPVVIIHAINNAVAYLLLETTDTQLTDTRAMIGDETVYRVVFAVSVLVCVVSVAAMGLMAKKRDILKSAK